jgi:hypothetical protein
MLAPLLILALHLQIQTTEVPEIVRGTGLFQSCKGAIRWMDAPEAAKPRADDENFDNCTAYIGGFIEGRAIVGCEPPDATFGTLARVYVAYMEKNPKLLDNFRFVGLQLAITDSYPCHLKK